MSKRQEIRARRQRARMRNRVVVILLVAGGALLLALVLILPSLRPVGAIVTAVPNPHPQANGNAMGDPNAPVQIVEYSDFQCPFCARFYRETEPRIVTDYVSTGKVYFVYRSYGGWIGPESQKSAEAAYCAGDQNKFWEYHDILFSNHTGENVGDYTDKRLIAFADAIGLDMNQFRDCFNSRKYTDRVQQDLVDGQAAGIRVTPAFLVNGTIIEGAQPYDVFQQAIEAALASK